MRQSLSIVKSTALEVLSEPLTLLALLAALVLTVLAPAFHYHQFGDPTRMARDAGFSALFMCGSVVSVFGAVRVFRREVESGTLEMALSHPVSRTSFFLAKAAGVFVAFLAFSGTVFGTLTVVFEGAAIGGLLAEKSGDVSRLYGPCFAGGVAVLVLPLLVAAVLNRFGRFRFVLTAFVVAFSLSVAGFCLMSFLSGGRILRLVPVAVLSMLMVAVLTAASVAFSVRFRANIATSCTGAVFLLFVPAIGNYYLPDALSGGGRVPWSYVGLAALVAFSAVGAFLLLGIHLIGGRDIQWTR